MRRHILLAFNLQIASMEREKKHIFEGKQFTYSIHTNTAQSVLSRFVPRVTGTLVAADHVDALAVPAQPVTQLTFIDICEITNQR